MGSQVVSRMFSQIYRSEVAIGAPRMEHIHSKSVLPEVHSNTMAAKKKKEHKCGNRMCFVIFTIIFAIVSIVGLTFAIKPQAASGNDLDYGCYLNCCDRGEASCVDSSDATSPWEGGGTSCQDSKARCEAGESGFTDHCSRPGITKPSACGCLTHCGNAISETVGTFLLGCVLLTIGLSFAFTCMCGIFPCICFAKGVVVQPAPVALAQIAQPAPVAIAQAVPA